ncbi:MAG: glycosyltransferase [Chloroflexota bacterium]
MLDFIFTAAAGLYITGTMFVVIFVSGFGLLLLIYLLTRSRRPQPPVFNEADLLSVTVQLPIYNEAHVVDRLMDACVRLDYPQHKLFIQVLDDSTDHTSDLIAARVCALHQQGFINISHIQRQHRDGYKAGALAYGTARVCTDCVVIFDADFVPPPDFLRRTMPYFNTNPRLSLIQTRWDHLNRRTNWLTHAQALSIDAHFGIEQVARSRGHLPMSMNGTGGIWRVEAIRDAGGWSARTLTEDMDLSYRAFMRGWEFLYLVDVTVPGELPPLVRAYKLQQARWATGSTQCLLRHSIALLGHQRLSLLKKLMGTLHLAQYAIQPVILLLFLLSPVLIAGEMFQRLPGLRIMALAGLIPPLLITVGQIELHHNWRANLLYFPVQVMAAVAIVLNNSLAVVAAFLPRQHEFKRTPKFDDVEQHTALRRRRRAWQRSQYLPAGVDAVTYGELVLAAYAFIGLLLAWQLMPALVPYMLTYAVSFLVFAVWNLIQGWQSRNRNSR